ncbi:MAG: ABC transporter substrate-binding protein [Dehalococcoidia bacterium]
MRQENSYWVRRLNSSRLSRRRFVGGAATAGVGAASLALVGCGDDDDDDDDEPTSPAGTTPTQPAAAQKEKGGIARFSSANATFDTFDVDRSRFTPFAVLIGYTNLGFIQYKSFTEGELEGAFASDWEQPDDGLSVSFTLREGMKWHNKAPVNGRAATVDDMVAFLKRNQAGLLADGTVDQSFYRKAEYANIDSVTATDAKTVTVKFKKPDPFFLGTLASGYAKIQAPEAIAAFEKDYANTSAAQIIGTGPYTLTEFKAEGSLSIRRNPDFTAWDTWIDGIDYFPLFTDNAALQSAFEQKQIDAYGPRTKAVLDDLLNKYKGQLADHPSFAANPMAGTYWGGSAPWNNPNLIGAIFRSINRRELIAQMFQGRAALSGNIPPTQSAFTITERELITYEGYREDYAKEAAEAKAMWAAGGGPALGEIIVDIPDIWEGAYGGVSTLIKNMLESNLGNTFTPKIEPYTTINTKLPQKLYGNGNNNIWYGWISDVTQLEPSLSLFNVYNSKGPQFPFIGGAQVAKIDSNTDKMLIETDIEVRKELCKDTCIELIKAYGAGIPYNMININNTLQWNYYHGTEDAAFVTAHQFANQAYMDQKDASWSGRPA